MLMVMWTWWWRSISPSSSLSLPCKSHYQVQHDILLKTLISSFMGISSSLPQTAAVKMIDIWMIFTMMYPFTGVMLQSYLQVTRGTSFIFHKILLQFLFSISTNQTTRLLSNSEGHQTRAGQIDLDLESHINSVLCLDI